MSDTLSLFRYKKPHLIGIKGAGMTALAELLLRNGMAVTGSDTDEVFFTDEILTRLGIAVAVGFAPEHIPDDADLIIYSTAYTPERNTELAAALASKRPVLSYPEALGLLTREKLTLAVCGTHGKTTTSALLADTLDYLGQDPSAIVGSRIMSWGGNALAGHGNYLVLEADEYQNKLAHYQPFAVILTSIDYDHPDFFPTEHAYEQAFIDFVARIPAQGVLVYCADSASVVRIAEHAHCRKVSYGTHGEAEFRVTDYTPVTPGFVTEKDMFRQSFSVVTAGQTENYRLRLAGVHNALNATAVVALLSTLGLKNERVTGAIERFTGTERRFEYIGERYGAMLYDDYAHHPEELRVTLRAFRDLYPDKKITAIFHPHSFTRTEALLSEFAQSFDDADRVFVLDIYGSAREVAGHVSSADLVNELNRYFPGKAEYVTDSVALTTELEKTMGRNDVIITVGAGNVWEISHSLAKKK
jgi:UDP-N-acetylmuramate--alanine ligase